MDDYSKQTCSSFLIGLILTIIPMRGTTFQFIAIKNEFFGDITPYSIDLLYEVLKYAHNVMNYYKFSELYL
jgi:hypothetical protein